MNPAARVSQVLEHFKQVPKDHAVHQGYATYLGVDPYVSGNEAMLELAAVSLIEELNATATLLQGQGFSDPSFDAIVSRIRNGLSARRMDAVWSGLRADVGAADVLIAFKLASFCLKDLDEVADDGAIDELTRELDQQEKSLATSKLPAGIRAVLERQAATLRSAIAMYRIRGAASLRDAQDKITGDFSRNLPALREAYAQAAPEEKSALERAESLAKRVGPVADTMQKVIGLAEKGATGLQHLISFIS